MIKHCVYAHTEVGPYNRYPAYLNVSQREDGVVEITVRTRDTCGAGMIELSPAMWAAFKLQISEPV
jgi:hypothetical protein